VKKTILGLGTLLSGSILFLAVFFAASNGIEATMRMGWNPEIGIFWSAMANFNLIPIFVIAIIMMLTGFAIMIAECYAKPKK